MENRDLGGMYDISAAIVKKYDCNANARSYCNAGACGFTCMFYLRAVPCKS